MVLSTHVPMCPFNCTLNNVETTDGGTCWPFVSTLRSEIQPELCKASTVAAHSSSKKVLELQQYRNRP